MNQTSNTANVKAKSKAKRSMGRSVLTLREVPSLSKDDKSFLQRHQPVIVFQLRLPRNYF
jgi:hypothetical protein